jgi:prepilin-type N-terminal cleavage/methylation domain-containing protein
MGGAGGRIVTADHRDTHEAGVTLVELLVAVVIMGIAFVAILSAIGTAIIVSDVHKRQATAETVLQSWAETLKSAAYQTNPGTAYNATQLGVTVPNGYTAQAAQVSCDGNLTTNAFDSPGPPPCSASGLEQITLTVTTARGVTKTTSVLKRGTS